MTRVAIVGGGPSGSATAIHLVRAGVPADAITLYDRATFPRPKLCGGALTWRGTELLRELLGHDADAQPLEGGLTRGLEFRCVLGAFDIIERGPQWLYDRAHLDDQLLTRVKALGVHVREAHAVREVEPRGEAWSVRGRGPEGAFEEAFDWLVGADGARGAVRRSLGELRSGIVGRLVEAVYEKADERAARFDPERLYFDFDPLLDGIPGYAWIFQYPKPGSATGALWKIGIMDGRGVSEGRVLREWTDDYAERNGFRRVESKIAGWPEHYYHPRSQAHRPGLVLVGEAWGVDPLLGEGIAPSFETARYAARRMAEAIGSGTRTIPKFERDFLRSEEGKNLRFQFRLAKLLYAGKTNRWLRVLFGHEYMREVAARGTEAYGKLEHRTWEFVRAYLWQSLRRGFPSSRPIPRLTEGPSGGVGA